MTPDKNKFLNYFTEIFNLKSLINEPACFKSHNPLDSDLILTNHRSSFMKIAVLETGISDHHKMISSILKHTFTEGPPKPICYRDLKDFDQKAFNSYLESKISVSEFLWKVFANISRHYTIICSFERKNYSLQKQNVYDQKP